MTSLSPAARVVLVWLVLAAALLALRAPTVDRPGLYYDEAFLAQQARDFLQPERGVEHPPGTSSVFVLGRPLALWNAAYLGSLKSQLLIPALATFGSSAQVVRLATLATALTGMLFFTLWARRLLGEPIAWTAFALVLLDPSFLFFSTYEWGPYTTLLLCRGIGLYGLTVGWQRRSAWRCCGAGLVLGLGVYARADFGVVLACGGLALLLVRGPALLREARERALLSGLTLASVLLGAWPMLRSVMAVLETSGNISDRGGLGYKAQVLWTTLDGSHYYRVIAEGGLFDSLFRGDAPASLFGFATLAAVPFVAWLAFGAGGRRFAGEDASAPALRFIVLTGVLLAGAMWLVPGAVRAHHMLNVLPLPHLLVAASLVALARQKRFRLIAAALAVVIVVAALRVTTATDALIERTGGRGRFSDALNAIARELDATPGTAAVALDWGFFEPLVFLTQDAVVHEPIWAIPRALQRGRPWVHAGDARHLYLVHDAPYDLFQLGPKFLTAARAQRSDVVQIERHDDREGNAAFYAVRFTKPHRLVYSGEFTVHF